MTSEVANQYFLSYFGDMATSVRSVDTGSLIAAADLIRKRSASGGKIIIVGNGGSAAMASHVSVDLTKAARIRAINFNEADLLTCYSNDYGYDMWVDKALESYADKSDVAILISSSGKSPNIINGVAAAHRLGLSTVTFSGFGSDNPLRNLGHINFWCNSDKYNVVEMTHHIWLLSIVDFIISRSKI